MQHGRIIWLAAALTCGGTSLAFAADEAPKARPEMFRKLIECRAVADDAARLACYDATASALDQAERDRQLVIVDRAQVKEARRSLFGFSLPKISLFENGDRDGADAKEFSNIETTIKDARVRADGRLVIILEDGARWVQTDERVLPSDARPGQKIKIREAAMGSYFANINGQIAIRMKREN